MGFCCGPHLPQVCRTANKAHGFVAPRISGRALELSPTRLHEIHSMHSASGKVCLQNQGWMQDGFRDIAVPLALHSDGVAITNVRGNASKKADALSWTSLLSLDKTRMTHYLIWFAFGHFGKTTGLATTWHSFWCKLTQSVRRPCPLESGLTRTWWCVCQGRRRPRCRVLGCGLPR